MNSLSKILLLMLASPVLATEPAQFDYMMNCQGCHLPNGEGFPAHQVPAVKDHLGKFLHVEGGRQFLIQVPGSAQSDLSDEKLTSVINWMLTTFSPNELPESFSPYTAEEVGHLRQDPLIDVKGIRAKLITRIERLASKEWMQNTEAAL